MMNPKRLIVACDGTWMNSDNGFERNSWLPWDKTGSLQVPSNVTRICRAILSHSPTKDIQQIVYYQAGIGSQPNLWDHLIGGMTGAGISEDIREAYGFIANNYEPNDEIFLLGFSRGAFTARTIAALISDVGLLTKHGMVEFYPIFTDWQNKEDSSFVSQWPNQPYPKKPRFGPTYVDELGTLGLSRLGIQIRAVGVWDTVGSLGIPDMSLVPMPPPEYAFVNTEVSPNVQNAFHALALDEHRKPFSPTIWERPEGQELPFKLEQVWFPGVHSNIGGSYADTEIADISLAWMMSRLDQFIDFDPTYITWQRELNVKYYERQEPPRVQPWAFGELYDSLIGWAVLGGSKTRTPGQYHVTNSKTGKSESRKLHHTEEHIHPCVRARITAGCRGIQGKSLYKPRALKGFRLLAPGEAVADSNIAHNLHSADSLDRFRWVYHCHDGTTVIIPECNMGDVELQLKATLPALTGSMPMFAQKNVSTDAV